MEIIGALAFLGLLLLIFWAVRGTARGVYKGVTGNDPKANAVRAAAEKLSVPVREAPEIAAAVSGDDDAMREHIAAIRELNAKSRVLRKQISVWSMNTEIRAQQKMLNAEIGEHYQAIRAIKAHGTQ